MNPRDLIVKGLLDSGFTEIHRTIRTTCSILFQKPNYRAFIFRFDDLGNYVSTGHLADGDDYLLPLAVVSQPSRFIVADLPISTCGTAHPAHVFDKAYETYWHVERVVGHPHRATRIDDRFEPRVIDGIRSPSPTVTSAEDLVCAELLDAVSAYHDQCELEELEAWRDQLNED